MIRFAHSGLVSDRLLPRCPAAHHVGVIASGVALIAVVFLALGFGAARLAATWSGEMAEKATLHVFASEDAVEAQALRALEVLRTTTGVRAVRIIELDEQRELLAPWFGDDLVLNNLPMPLLIEVEADRIDLDAPALIQRLATEAPGATFDDHVAWRAPLVETALRLRSLSVAGLVVLALMLGAALSLAAVSSGAENGPIIRTLRQIGARDSFIAAVFSRRFVRQAGIGAAIGALCGIAIILLLPVGSPQGFFILAIGPKGVEWLAFPLVPAACAMIAWLTSEVSIRRRLRNWD